jgi:hypothetical protein
VLHRNARALPDVASGSVDLVLTDPPYFDNIAYSELSDFYLPWLQLMELASPDGTGPNAYAENLAAKRRDAPAIMTFREGLTSCFGEVARVLKDDGRLVFTYQHKTAGAWEALGTALARAGLRPVQIFPLLGNARGLHTRAGTSAWDAVFVAVKGRPQAVPLMVSDAPAAVALHHAASWFERLQARGEPGFGAADLVNFRRACLVSAALGGFPAVDDACTARPLGEVLENASILEPAGAR